MGFKYLHKMLMGVGLAVVVASLLLGLALVQRSTVVAQEGGATGNPVAGPDAGPLPAGVVSVTPDTIVRPPPANCPPFDAVPAGGVVTTEYQAQGLHFSVAIPGDGNGSPGAGQTTIFDDPPNAWGGVNAANECDLLASINGRFVTKDGSPGKTNFMRGEMGFMEVGSGLLEAYNCDGALVASSRNDDGLGPNGRTTAEISSPEIAYFRFSTPGGDTYGVDQIDHEDVVPCDPLAKLEAKLDRLETKADDHGKAIGKLEGKADGLGKAVSALETKADGLGKALKALEIKADGLGKKADGLAKAVKALEVKADKLEGKADKLTKAVADLTKIVCDTSSAKTKHPLCPK